MESLTDKFYARDWRYPLIIRWTDGTFPTKDELDRLLKAGYIYRSVYEATLEAMNTPLCSKCNRYLP